jgi:hypothetical protein
MKKTLLLGACAAFVLCGAANAQTTVVELTGATAFRSAAIAAINNAFLAESGAGNFATAFTNTSASGGSSTFNNGSMQIWRGKFPGIAGTTVVRTSWNGSVEGIRAVAVPGASFGGNPTDPLYLLPSVLGANGTTTGIRFHSDPGGPGAAVNALNFERATSDLAFSDVAQSSTPVSGLTLAGGPVGVVVFSMVASRTWSDDRKVGDAYGLRIPTNITAQQFRTMAQRGFVPMSFFTGNASDTKNVYLTGRNDGSGTRTSYLYETGVGAATPIKQYLGYDRSSTTNLPSIFLVPANGGFDAQGVARPEYQSTVWGLNLDGNGGHVSSNDVRTDLSKTTSSTAVYAFDVDEDTGEATADTVFLQSPADKLYMISWVTYNDARTARGTGLASARTAEVLGYDGVRLEGLAGDNPPTNLTGLDLDKVTNGAYTAWNFQQLYYIASAPGATSVFNSLKTQLNNPTVIGTAGLPTGLMNVNRTVDGGVILPGSPN